MIRPEVEVKRQEITMNKNLQRGPFSSLVHAINLLLQGRIHFPKERLGETVNEGEEFAILLPNTALDGVREIAQRVCSMVASKPVNALEKLVPVTVSLGVASLVKPRETSIETLLDQADHALYAAKQAGRNRVMVWGEY